MKNCLFSLLLLLASLTAVAQQPVQQVPQFMFYKQGGQPFTKQNMLPNKKAFFVFFDSDCEHCQHAMHEINSEFKRFDKTEIYLVTLDGPEKINRFMSVYGSNLVAKRNVMILRDLRNEFIKDFNPRQYPSMLLFSVKGNLLIYRDDPNALPQIFKLL